MVRHQELCLVQQWQVALAGVPLNDHRHFVWVLLTDLLHVALPLGCREEGLPHCIILLLTAAFCYTTVHCYCHLLHNYSCGYLHTTFWHMVFAIYCLVI